MKRVFLIITICFLSTGTIYSQTANWNWIDSEQRHYAHVTMGYDFGVTTQIGYDYSSTVVKPVLFTLDYSFPMGKNLIDDVKFRFGGQVEVAEYKSFIASLKILGNFKRHETDLVRIANFGSETSVLVGYYKRRWHIATEFGFLKPIVSNLKHSKIMKENYPSIQDGWYTSSGGYFFYGIQSSKSVVKSFDASLRIGFTNAQADHEDAILPYYTQIGVIKKF